MGTDGSGQEVEAWLKNSRLRWENCLLKAERANDSTG